MATNCLIVGANHLQWRATLRELGVVELSLMSERSDAGAMPNTPSAYRLWPQHAHGEPSHALGLPPSHTRRGQDQTPMLAGPPIGLERTDTPILGHPDLPV